MRRIGITGHRGLPAATTHLVEKALRDALADHGASITGVTLLADGADQLFARAVVDQGGQIEVIVPAAQYRAGLSGDTHGEYDELFSHASTVYRLDFTGSTPETPWPPGHARDQGRPVRILWPNGASCD